MKAMIKVFSVFVLIIMVVSCATTPRAIPKKYNLDNELETIKQIHTFSVSSLEQADIQSIILRANVSDYYLLVLRRPMKPMMPSLTIGISSLVSSITPGFDRIYVENPPMLTENYIIDKIYKLEGKEQAKEIKERLRKN